MRDYSKIGPQFWNGKTGKALKAKGQEAVIVGLYLMTCQHANMIGLYYLNIAYIAADTGLGFEGATKGLASACEVGFCHYDEETEVVWVTEMALYQIADRLEPKDLRSKGVQREYDGLPENPYLTPFYQRYGKAFNMTSCRGEAIENDSPYQAPSNPLRSQEQEQEQEQEQKKNTKPDGFVDGVDPADQKVDVDKVVPIKTPNCEYDQIVLMYHEILPNLPAVRVMTDDRKRAMKRRWDWVMTSKKANGERRAINPEQAREWFGKFFETAKDNKFLMNGSGNPQHQGWRCSLDFLMGDKGLKQVFEMTEVAA